MKKMTLIVIAMLLVTGASGAFGYFFIYVSDDSEVVVAVQDDQTQETDDTVDEGPEEPEDPPAEDNDTFFRGMKDECFEHGDIERCWKLYVPNETDETQSIPLILDILMLLLICMSFT